MNVRAVDERPVMHVQLLHCPMAPDADCSIFHVCELYQPGVVRAFVKKTQKTPRAPGWR
ncbi:hypothetical protein EDE08_111176 [Bradyrhizobium sp. R2.2-H]|nr:hypothetical protein EDE10_111176 [Bradyrhizobium sp. Y-H1]TCU68767.1 hypothetical protein EDE08_111176 [Bradyrhizobium sp. R2.2-H]